MKALVTGGCGFIGSHLVELLLVHNHDVTVFDNLSSGRLENIAGFVNQPRFRFHNVDIRDRQSVTDAMLELKPDWVFHLAGLADIVPSIENPTEYYDANVTGTFNVLQAAVSSRSKRFVYAASSSSYGIPSKYPTPEDSPISPLYPYALTKSMGEELVLHWSTTYGLPAVSLRLFNVFGPRARTGGTYGAVFGVFLAQKLNGKPFTIVGDGEQTRDFTYVTDVANAFMTAASSQVSGEAMNVGSGRHYSVNYLVSLLGGSSVNIPKRPGEPDCTFADTDKIRSMLGWAPEVSFEQGVETMLKHIDHWGGAPIWDAESIAAATRTWFKHLGSQPSR